MRKPIAWSLRSIARLRRVLAASRGVLARCLAGRPAAARPAAGSAEPGVYDPLFDHLDAELAAVESDLRNAEDLYIVALQRVQNRREERHQAATALEFLHTPVFRHLARLPQGQRAGISGRVPNTPPLLERQVPYTIELLRELACSTCPPAGRRTHTPPIGGVSIEVDVVAADLDTGLRALDAAMTAARDANADARFARQQANRAYTATDGVVPYVAQTLEGLGRLVGRKRISAKVRGCFD